VCEHHWLNHCEIWGFHIGIAEDSKLLVGN